MKWHKRLATVFMIVTLADSTLAISPEHVCGIAYETSSLKVPSCEGSSVTIVSQDSHFSKSAAAVHDKMLSVGFDRQIMAFFEGDLAAKNTRSFTRGTEVREAKALAATSLLPLLQALALGQTLGDVASNVTADHMAQLAFGEMVGLWPEITIELSRSNQTSTTTRKVAKQILPYFVSADARNADSVILASLSSSEKMKAQPLSTFGDLPSLVEFGFITLRGGMR